MTHLFSEVFPWLPPFSIIKHPRARFVKFSIEKSQIRIMVPSRYQLKNLLPIISSHKDWILKNFKMPPPFQVPSELQFLGGNECWEVKLIKLNKPLQVFIRPHHEIVLLGNGTQEDYIKKLTIFIKNKAKALLINKIALLSQKFNLTYQAVFIRSQKARWGSCDINKIIYLNYKLIFLPERLVDHVLIHELCHTVYFNHSDHFWQLVETCDPKVAVHKKLLKLANQFIPEWL